MRALRAAKFATLLFWKVVSIKLRSQVPFMRMLSQPLNALDCRAACWEHGPKRLQINLGPCSTCAQPNI